MRMGSRLIDDDFDATSKSRYDWFPRTPGRWLQDIAGPMMRRRSAATVPVSDSVFAVASWWSGGGSPSPVARRPDEDLVQLCDILGIEQIVMLA